MLKLDRYGVSSVVSVILVVGIVVSSSAVILAWGLPYIEENKMNNQLENSKASFEIMDNTISNLIVDGVGSIGNGGFSSIEDKSNINVDSKGGKLIIKYNFNESYDFEIDGLGDEKDRFNIKMKNQVVNNWHKNDWEYRRKIVIDKDKVDGNFNDFPVMIRCLDIQAYQADGGDILFTDESGNELNHEIEYYNKDDQDLYAWVSADLSADTDTILYMYYYNPLLDPNVNKWNIEDTWDNNFVMVQHLNESIGTHFDSTNNNYDGTASVSNQDAESIDGADAFDSSNNDNVIVSPTNTGITTGNFTVSFWMKPRSANSRSIPFSFGSNSDNRCVYYEWADGDQKIKQGWWGDNGVTSSSSLGLNTWHFVTGSYNEDDDKSELYINGSFVSNSNYANSDLGNDHISIGYIDGGGSYFDGILDEVRISNVDRGANWINTSFNSMRFGQFYTFEEAVRREGYLLLKTSDIYRLDPEAEVEKTDSYTSYREIYEWNKCAQEFTVPSFGGGTGTANLVNISLYLSKTGKIDSELQVSIFKDVDADDFPDDEVLGSQVKINPNNLSYEYEWYDIGFSSPISLNEGNNYFIRLNTSGGDYANFYRWQMHNKPGFFEGDINASEYCQITSPSTWKYIENMNFSYRTIFNDNLPPSISYNGNNNFYTGINYTFNLSTIDSEGDSKSIYIDWGDGSFTKWQDLSSDPYHLWVEPGTYDVSFTVKDEYANINETDYSVEFNIIERVKIPLDLKYSNDPIEGSITHNSNGIDEIKTENGDDLTGSLLIDLFTYSSSVPIARIWVFDLGCISHEAHYSTGNIKTYLENGAVITKKDDDERLINDPCFYVTDNAIAFRVIQIKEDSISSASGSSNFNAKLKILNNLRREEPTKYLDYYYESYIHNLSLSFYGKNSDVWVDYFQNVHNFSYSSNYPNTVIYPDNGKKLILDSSVVKADINFGG